MNERSTTDVDQCRALMALSDDELLQAWKEARDLSGPHDPKVRGSPTSPPTTGRQYYKFRPRRIDVPVGN